MCRTYDLQSFGDDLPIFSRPIHYAATAGNVELIVQLVGAVVEKEKYVFACLGIGSDSQSGGTGYMSGYTSLHLAVAYNRLKVVAYLVRQFPRLVTIHNADNEYPVKMIGKNCSIYMEHHDRDWFDNTKHKILWWLLRTDFTGWMLSKDTNEVKPRRPMLGFEHVWNERRGRHERLRYMTVEELIKATFPETPEMPDYLTPMSNLMNGKIISLEKKQATEEKKEFTIWDIMKERPHSAMCNPMYLILMRIFGKNCPERELGESVVFIMKFAFRNVMDMIMPISKRDEYWYLGATQDEIDAQEESDVE
jgi:hypothetical protein